MKPHALLKKIARRLPWKKKPTIANYLENKGYKCVTIIYNGGDTTSTRRVEIAAGKANRDNAKFILENSLKLIEGREY